MYTNPSTYRLLLGLLFSLIFLTDSLGQNLLAIENPYALKREIYQPGDLLKFKSEGNKRWFEGIIQEVYDSSVVMLKEIVYYDGANRRKEIERYEVAFTDIRYVKYNGRSKVNGFKKVFGFSSLLAGGYLFGVTAINLLTTDSDSREVDQGSLYISGGFAATGLILLATAKNKHKLGKKWKIRMMPPMSPDLPIAPGPK